MLPTGIPEVTLDSVFSVLEVDSEVVRFASSGAPNYPPSLLEAGIEGVVESEFVVDTTGWVDLTSVKILFATDPEFSRSVHQALNEMQFRAAMRGTRKVRQLVHQRFTFQIQAPPPTASAAS
jgi:TonB family protein